jgi:hypothetical protein
MLDAGSRPAARVASSSPVSVSDIRNTTVSLRSIYAWTW